MFGIVEEVLSENLIKASEAAEKIGVSLVTVKRMIKDGRLAGEKVGNRWQVTEQSVVDFLNIGDPKLSSLTEQKEISAEQNTEQAVEKDQDIDDIQDPTPENGAAPLGNLTPTGLTEDFPIKTKLEREFGHLFSDIQFEPEQFYSKCLQFVNDEMWIYWRASTGTFVYEQFDNVPILDLQGVPLPDLIAGVIAGQVESSYAYHASELELGRWRIELYRSIGKNENQDRLYRRCAYSFPFIFRYSMDDDEWRSGHVMPLDEFGNIRYDENQVEEIEV